MTPDAFRTARHTIAEADGIQRPYTMREFGLLIGFSGVRPDHAVRDVERGRALTGPVQNVVLAMLAGWRPPVWYTDEFGRVRADDGLSEDVTVQGYDR